MDPKSNAIRYNERVMRILGNRFAAQPSSNLMAAFPKNYRTQLRSKSQGLLANKSLLAHRQTDPAHEAPKHPAETRPTIYKTCPTIDETLPATVLHPLSDDVYRLIIGEESAREPTGLELSQAIARTLRSSAIIFQSQTDSGHFVALCSETLIIKAVTGSDSTEYDTLRTLHEVMPSFPAPKPYGYIQVGDLWLMFTSYTPGVSLDTIWSDLTEEQKVSIRDGLENILLKLREIPYSDGRPLGGVGGQGCKDTRRHTRTSTSPIYTAEQIWDFMYGCARNKNTVYGRFLRSQTFPPRKQRIVFIHGDVRPANIIVQQPEDGKLSIASLIDWEKAGFYPADLECIKAMNTLSPIETDDWFLYLPDCISPKNHVSSWYCDRAWDEFIV